MLSYQFYKLTHYLGIFMVIMSLGGLTFLALQKQGFSHPWKKIAAISHGVGLFLVLLGGFGMLARLGIVSGLPGWIYGKLFIWVCFGAVLVVLKRFQNFAKGVWWFVILGAFAAAYLALHKPF